MQLYRCICIGYTLYKRADTTVLQYSRYKCSLYSDSRPLEMVLGKSLLKPSHHFNLTGSWQGREYPGIFLLVARESLKIAKIIYSNGICHSSNF